MFITAIIINIPCPLYALPYKYTPHPARWAPRHQSKDELTTTVGPVPPQGWGGWNLNDEGSGGYCGGPVGGA